MVYLTLLNLTLTNEWANLNWSVSQEYYFWVGELHQFTAWCAQMLSCRVMSIMICARRHASAGKMSPTWRRCLFAIAHRRNFCVAHRTSNLSFRWCFRFTFMLTRACIKKYTIIITCYCNKMIIYINTGHFYLWQKMDPTRHQETFFSCMHMLLQSFYIQYINAI